MILQLIIFYFSFCLLLTNNILVAENVSTACDLCSPCTSELTDESGSSRNVCSQEIVAHAKESRFNTSSCAEEELERLKSVLEQAYKSLASYDTHSSLEDAVHAFLSDALSVDVADFSIINAVDTDLRGKSQDIVFLIKDQSDQLCYVIKAFRNPREFDSKFLPEISSLDLIKQLALPHVGAIESIAFARYKEGDKEWGLLLESAAKGKRMDQYILQLANQTEDQQQVSLEIVKNAFHRMGESFAGLHRIKSSTLNSIPLSEFNKYDDKLTKLMKDPFITSELAKEFSLSDFTNYIEQIKNEVREVLVYYTYWHGDAHLGNLFYDEVQDDFYYIDVAKMHRSIDLSGEPLLDGTIDLMRIEENLIRKSLGILNKEEIDQLLHTFYRAYESQAGQLPDERLLIFYKTYVKLGRLIRYSRYVKEQDPAQNSTDKMVFEDAIRYFKNELAKQLNQEVSNK